jgi:flagellar motor switch protein FliM
MHLLGSFTSHFRAALAETFRTGLNRRHGASFQVEAVEIGRPPEAMARGRWYGCTTPFGRVAFAMDRPVLLAVLDYRYGAPVRSAADVPAPDDVRETATEERLAATLCARWTESLVACLGPVEPAELTATPCPAPAAGGWTVTVRVTEASLTAPGTLRFVLDDAAMAHLLRSIAPSREKAKAAPNSQPVAARLPLVLTGRLLEKEIALGDVLDLRPGDVIPVSLGLADVLVDDARLFTAAVTEHKGKLCLTSFDDAE